MTAGRSTPAAVPAASSVHEAQGRTGALPAGILPLRPSMRLWGPALPVRSLVGDNLALHHAIYAARPGEVLVVDAGGAPFGYWGEVMTRAATARGLGGLVLDGGVRDSERLRAQEFPVFARLISIQGTGKQPDAQSTVGAPADFSGTLVRRGDLVVGDADGVVVVPVERADEVVAKAVERERKEEQIMQQLDAGATTLDLYGLPTAAAETHEQEEQQ